MKLANHQASSNIIEPLPIVKTKSGMYLVHSLRSLPRERSARKLKHPKCPIVPRWLQVIVHLDLIPFPEYSIGSMRADKACATSDQYCPIAHDLTASQ